MKISELRQKTKEELLSLLIESRNKLRDLRFSVQEGKVKNVREVRLLRKTIAQVLTLMKASKSEN